MRGTMPPPNAATGAQDQRHVAGEAAEQRTKGIEAAAAVGIGLGQPLLHDLLGRQRLRHWTAANLGHRTVQHRQADA